MYEWVKATFEHLRHIPESLPFMAMTANRAHLNTSRIVEAVIIALLAGTFSGYISVQKMELRIGELEKKIDRMYADIYQPVLRNRK